VSNEQNKFSNSRRRHKDESAVARQVKIAKQRGISDKNAIIKEPHRLVKHHAMDCGRPECSLCGNPRKVHGMKTPQELKLEQDLDNIRDKRHNGLTPDDE